MKAAPLLEAPATWPRPPFRGEPRRLALDRGYAHIRETGSSLGSPVPLHSFAEMNRVMGFEEIWRFDKEHAEI
jgi:hypothetical protein